MQCFVVLWVTLVAAGLEAPRSSSSCVQQQGE
eukprot:SAG11_NODE_38821_length_248_cov_31.510067_1_plen_31_part_01